MPWKYIGDGSIYRGVPHPVAGEELILSDEQYAEVATAFKEYEGVELATLKQFEQVQGKRSKATAADDEGGD